MSVKKIQPTIDEDSNDSLLNESNSLDMNKIHLNDIKNQQNSKTNGQINYTFNNDSGNCSNKKPTNGYLIHSQLTDEDQIELAPQKASSPLTKLISTQLNSTSYNTRINKVI